jgi:amidohydrolase
LFPKGPQLAGLFVLAYLAETMFRTAGLALLLCLVSISGLSQTHYIPSVQDVEAIYSAAQTTYVDLHEHPELSFHEVETARKMADGLRKLGYEVTTGVGGNGVVGVLKNGNGKTVLIRTDMDALPVPEKTGLPYASKVMVKDDAGHDVPVMHACGHDFHMASWLSTATLLSQNKNRWRGTVVMIGQPAEERVAGAAAMLKDGLFTRFPKPNYAIAIHDSAQFPAGSVAVVSGFTAANADSVDITIYGKGGHGAAPDKAVDPIVLAARIILSLQTIVSRETNPLDPAVVTVGSIHGGTKGNIIPDEVKLELTIRSYKDEVRAHTIEAIQRICRAEAMAVGAPKEPEIKVKETVHATYNDPDLSARLTASLKKSLGNERVVKGDPIMGAEDFSEFGRTGVPSVIMWIGAADPQKLAQSKQTGIPLPGTHSSLFAPSMPDSLKTAIRAESTAAFELLDQP